jgi:hypothetical protein
MKHHETPSPSCFQTLPLLRCQPRAGSQLPLEPQSGGHSCGMPRHRWLNGKLRSVMATCAWRGTVSLAFRSITAGTCALNREHTSAEFAAECPQLGKSAQERLETFRRRKRAQRQVKARRGNG